MGERLSTAEFLHGAQFSLASEPGTAKQASVTRENPTGVVGPEHSKVALRDAKEIVRAEMARQRQRLGTLTPEQEIGIETLLMSTASRISELVGRALDSLPIVS
jgi:hypothetical protein